MNKKIKVQKVRDLVNLNDVSSRFFERLAERTKNSSQTTVEHVIRLTKGERKDVVELFKELEDLQLGHFIPGRRGAQSRFEWRVRLTDVARAAFGEIDEIEEADHDDLDDETEVVIEEDTDANTDNFMLEHTFALRADLHIKLTLPADLSEKEADRLSMFIKTLPFAD